MRILNVEDLPLEGVKLYRFGLFPDDRGYFTEPFRESDIGLKVVQMNESVSKRKVVRGLHFQWNPFMGKLVRTLSGHMIDLVLDIRPGSPTLGKIITVNMPERKDCGEWIWVPPGFAHGNYFHETTRIEYLCTGEYSPGCECGISPFDPAIDWSLSDHQNLLRQEGLIVSTKDRQGLLLKDWLEREDAKRFTYGTV